MNKQQDSAAFPRKARKTAKSSFRFKAADFEGIKLHAIETVRLILEAYLAFFPGMMCKSLKKVYVSWSCALMWKKAVSVEIKNLK